MAYLAVNEDGKEVRFDGKYRPFLWEGRWYQPSDNSECVDGRNITLCNVGKTLPFGTIIALTGQKITFEDKPIKI